MQTTHGSRRSLTKNSSIKGTYRVPEQNHQGGALSLVQAQAKVSHLNVQKEKIYNCISVSLATTSVTLNFV